MDRNEQNTLGNIFLSHRAICSIVSHAAQTSYGIVGLAPKNLAAGIAAAIIFGYLFALLARPKTKM